MENFNFLGFDENYPHFSWMEYGWGILILWDFMKTWDFLDIFGTFLGLESSGNPGGLGSDACWDMALSNRLTLSQCWGNFSKESNDNPLVFFGSRFSGIGSVEEECPSFGWETNGFSYRYPEASGVHSCRHSWG
jgi:hypothetical protein